MRKGRYPHQLKPLQSERYPTKLLFFDCEAYEEDVSESEKVQKFRLAVTIYRSFENGRDKREVKVFKDKFMLAQYIHSRVKTKDTLFIFAHNVFYDFKISGVGRLLEKRFKWVLDSFYHASHSLILIYRHREKQSRIVFIDTQNYFQVPLAELGRTIGLPKMDIDVFTEDEQLLKQYCLRDVEIIERTILSLIDFLKKEQIPFAYTIASLAISALRRKFMKERIFVHANPEVDELEKRAYYGGRTECFFLGHIQECYKLDVNSMYPFCMKNPVPIDLVGYGEKYTPKRLLSRIRKGYLAIAEVMLDTPEPAFPKRMGGKLFFPIGRFWTVLCTPELLYALEKGYVVKIGKVAIYKAGYVFNEFVDYFFSKKNEATKQNNPTYRMFYKWILNALYGKFAQYKRQVLYQYEAEKEDWSKQYVLLNNQKLTELHIGKKILLIDRSEVPAFNSFIAISAHITSYARIYLYELMKKAGFDNIFYVDTDCIFTNRIGYERLQDYINEYELGMLKLEGVDYCYIRGLKNYKFGQAEKIKGVPKKAWREGDTFYFWSFEKFKGSLSKRLNDDNIHLFLQKRSLKNLYDKGIVKEDGRIEPLVINEG